jgi:hypothetical protein
MDKLEQYLEIVCRRIGGPRPLRQHIRQELREHLRDAVAEHRAAGLPEEAALAKALADFGGPEQVRSELEEAHGHRLLPVVIDQAMQWKEKTMRARWLWTTWAYLTAAVVIVVDMLFFSFIVNFELPKLEKIHADGWIVGDGHTSSSIDWMLSFLIRVGWAWQRAGWFMLLALAGWGLFEWRVRSENKPFMRLAGMGTMAAALTVFVAMTGAIMVLPFELGLPNAIRVPQRVAAARMAEIDTKLAALEEARARHDWPAVERNAEIASYAIDSLTEMAPALVIEPAQATKSEFRAQMTAAKASLGEAKSAGRDKNADTVASAVARVQQALGAARAAMKGLDK